MKIRGVLTVCGQAALRLGIFEIQQMYSSDSSSGDSVTASPVVEGIVCRYRTLVFHYSVLAIPSFHLSLYKLYFSSLSSV